MSQPGWYPDPDDANSRRYWDGTSWGPPMARSYAGWPPQTGEVPAPEMTPAALKRKRRGLWVLAVLVVVGGGVTAAALLTGSNPATFTVNGTFVLNGNQGTAFDTTSGDMAVSSDNSCFGTSGYNDVQQGAEVTISSASGTTLVVGALQGGTYTAGTGCQFTFSVAGVPSGRGPYGVSVTHRGTTHFSEQDMESGAVALSLGDGT